jgi:hypothetical protein
VNELVIGVSKVGIDTSERKTPQRGDPQMTQMTQICVHLR